MSSASHWQSITGFITRYFLGFNAVVLTTYTCLSAASVILSSYSQQRHDAPELEWKKYNPKHMVATAEAGKLLFAVVWLVYELSTDALANARLAATSPTEADHAGQAFPVSSRSLTSPKDDIVTTSSAGGNGVSIGTTNSLSSDPRYTSVAVSTDNSACSPSVKEKFSRRRVYRLMLTVWRRFLDEVMLFHCRQKVEPAAGGKQPPDEVASSPSLSATPTLTRNRMPDFHRRNASTMGEGEDDVGNDTTGQSFSCDSAKLEASRERPGRLLVPEDHVVEVMGGADTSDAEAEDPLGKTVPGTSGPLLNRRGSTPVHVRCAEIILAHVNTEAMLMMVPAIVYAVQNLFILDAQSKLDPMVYQVFTQTRILLTAAAMRLVMGTVITPRRWLSLCLLLCGVLLSRLGASKRSSRTRNNRFATSAETNSIDTASTRAVNRYGKQLSARVVAALASVAGAPSGTPTVPRSVGVAAAAGSAVASAADAGGRFMSGMTSLFTGVGLSVVSSVYMEAVFKKRAAHAKLSTRNIHLALFSLVYFAALALQEYRGMHTREALEAQRALYKAHPTWDSSTDPDIGYKTLYYDSFYAYWQDYFHGFDALVWVMILIKASNGMLIAIIMRYSDNIMKTLATALSIILSGVWGHFLFDNELRPAFILGAAVVCVSVVMYNLWK